MNNIVVEVDNVEYLVRYQILKSVVSRKHTTKEGKVIQQLEKHPTSCEVHLYKINIISTIFKEAVTRFPYKHIKRQVNKYNTLTYLGRGLSKCSDKDKFDRITGIRMAICNINGLSESLKYDINSKL